MQNGTKCGTFAKVQILECDCGMGCNWHIRALRPSFCKLPPSILRCNLILQSQEDEQIKKTKTAAIKRTHGLILP